MLFYPFNERLKETLTWAAENEVPVLSHCNYLGGIYNNDRGYIDTTINAKDPYNNNQVYPPNPITYQDKKSFWDWLKGRQESGNNLNLCSYYMEPNAYRSLLTYFRDIRKTPLKLCLAHYGGGNQIYTKIHPANRPKEELTPYGVLQKNWYDQASAMMQEFPSLYTDIAYALHDEKIHDELLNDIVDPDIENRVMFGTDFFLTEREGPEMQTYQTFRDKALKTAYGKAWDLAANSSIEKFLSSKYF